VSNIFWGVLIIIIGLVSGNSLFLGEVGIVSVFFDGLGLFWIGRGVYQLMQAKQGG
jgi:hypothetical protein